jgi:hypothetical protein
MPGHFQVCRDVLLAAAESSCHTFLPPGLDMPWLGLLVAVLSPRRPRFAPVSVHVGFVVDKVILGQGFSPSSLAFPFQYHSIAALHAHVSFEVWTTGLLVAAVQRHSLAPSTLTRTWTTLFSNFQNYARIFVWRCCCTAKAYRSHTDLQFSRKVSFWYYGYITKWQQGHYVPLNNRHVFVRQQFFSASFCLDVAAHDKEDENI